MDNKSAAFLKKQLEQNIAGFRARRVKNKRKAFFLRMTVVTLGAITTLLIALKTNLWVTQRIDSDFLAAAALASSAAVPIFSAWDAFFDHRWLWVRYAGAQQALYGVLDDLEFGGDKLSDKELEELYLRFRQVLQQTNDSWYLKRSSMEANDRRQAEQMKSAPQPPPPAAVRPA
jgi:hypothetical protein